MGGPRLWVFLVLMVGEVVSRCLSGEDMAGKNVDRLFNAGLVGLVVQVPISMA